MNRNWKKFIDYNTYTNQTDLIKDTGWLSPNTVYQYPYEYGSISTTNFDEPVIAGNQTSVQKYYDINNNDDVKSKPIWNNLNYPGYISLLSPNIDPLNRLYTTPILKFSDFNININDDDIITGIQIKIERSTYGMTDYDFSGHPEDQIFFTDNIKHYTYDNLISVSYDDDYTKFKNLSIPYTIENVTNQNGNNIILSKANGVWSSDTEDDKFVIYGNNDELWLNSNSETWTKDKIDNLNIFVQANQKIFRGYYDNYNTELSSLYAKQQKIAWYENKYINGSYGVNNMSYEVSKIYNVYVKIFYKPNHQAYNMSDRDSIFIDDTININDVYFNFQKCLNGICYKFVDSLENIYNPNLITDDNKSINNLFNEYNIIDEYMMNLYHIDVSSNINIDITKNHYSIDTVTLKPNQTILLTNQSNPIENDVYIVDENYYLINSNYLYSTDTSYRAKFYIKSGTNKEKQYFLQPQGNNFPITNQYKSFLEGHSYIIKHQLNYNIHNKSDYIFSDDTTLSNPSKILFTNYDIARTMGKADWERIIFEPSGTTLNINYIDYDYNIDYDGLVTFEQNGIDNTYMYSANNHTSFYFTGDFNIDDSIIICIKGATGFTDLDVVPEDSLLIYYTTIRNINADYLQISGEIPNWIMYEVSTNYVYKIINLHHCDITNLHHFLNYSPFGDIIEFLNIDNNIVARPKNDGYFEYFDFSNIIITDVGFNSGLTFDTTNYYQNYKLLPFLQNISSGITLPEVIYNEEYIPAGEYTIEELYLDYTTPGYETQASMYKLTPNDISHLNYFKAFTFIDIGTLIMSGDTILSPYELYGDSTRTLIYEVFDDYMIIEKPKNFVTFDIKTAAYDIINVSKLKDISDLLFDICYYNDSLIYYKYARNIYNKICSEYALIVKDNIYIRNIATGIFYEKNEIFNFDIFDINIDKNFNHLNDVNLYYKPIELIDIGVNKITKLPIPLEYLKLDIDTEALLYYTGQTQCSGDTCESYLYTISNIDGKLYANIKYQNKILFDVFESDNTTSKKEKNNATLIFNNIDLSIVELNYNYLISNNIDAMIYDFNIIGIDEISYNYGYSKYGNSILFKPYIFDDIILSGNTYGHIFSHIDDVIDKAIIYYSTIGDTILSSMCVNDDKKYILISSDKDYNYFINNSGSTEIFNNIHDINKTCAIIKYSDDFENIDWYRVFYGADLNVLENYILDDDDIQDIIILSGTSTASWNQSIDVDFEPKNHKNSSHLICKYENIYSCFKLDEAIAGTTENGLISYNGFIESLSASLLNYKSFIINKMNLDGDIIWSKPIYRTTAELDFDYIKKITYYEDNIYIIINSSSKLMIEDVEYGSNNEHKMFVIKIDKNGLLVWIKELGGDRYNEITDIEIYDSVLGEFLILCGNYQTYTTIDSYNIFTSTNNYASWIAKMNIYNGDIISLYHKTSSDDVKINNISVIDEQKIMIGGDFDGGIFIGGSGTNHYFESNHPEIFIEEIKINDI